MNILKEYYPLQVLQIFAGVAPRAYRSNSKNQFNYSSTAILSAVVQTGLGLRFMYWAFSIAANYMTIINVDSNVTKVEELNEATGVIFRISISLLINIVAIILRIYNIIKASKLPEIFEEINRIDFLLRITSDYSKSSRRRTFGFVILLLFICWVVHVPHLSLTLYGTTYGLFLYYLCNRFAQFTIASIQWSQTIFLVLLKRRYSFLNDKLNLIYASVASRNYSDEATITTWLDNNEKKNGNWSTSVKSVSATVDDLIENGGKYKIWNYLNNVKKTFSSNGRSTFKINEPKVNPKSNRKKRTSYQNVSSNILRIRTAQELEILRIAHQELSTLLTRITSFFCFQIFLSFCSDVISLLDNLHYIVQQLIEPWQGGTSMKTLLRRPAFFTAWTLEYFTRILCIVWSNSSTNSEAKKTLLHLERLQAPLLLRNYQEALEELEYFKRHMYTEVALSSSGALINFHGSLILRVIDTSINFVFFILQQTFRTQLGRTDRNLLFFIKLLNKSSNFDAISKWCSYITIPICVTISTPFHMGIKSVLHFRSVQSKKLVRFDQKLRTVQRKALCLYTLKETLIESHTRMFILNEYYHLQVLQIFAGVAPRAYRSNSKNQFDYSIIAIFSGLFQTGFNLTYMYWILPNITRYLKAISVINKVTEIEATNETTSVLFRIATSYLINIVAIVLRLYNIVKASKLQSIFKEINRIDSLLRITNVYSKSSRKRVFGLVILLLLISWIIHVPFYSIVIYGKLNGVLFYHLSNTFAHFTITATEWTQVIFLVLLKRRYSFLNDKINLIYTSLANYNYSEESTITTYLDDNKMENGGWYTSVESVSETVDNLIESGGKFKICNYLNNLKKIFSSKDQTTFKINKRKVITVSESSRTKNFKMNLAKNSRRKHKTTTTCQTIPFNILRISTAQELEILRIAHQQLSTMLMRIISFFRFQIFLSFCSDVISLLDNLHYIVQQLIQPWKAGAPLRLLVRHPAVFITWTVEYFTRITCIVWSNSSTNSEAKKTLLHLERLQAPLLLRNYQEALEELEYFKRHMYTEVALSSSGALINFHGSLILRVIDTSINYVFLMLQQTFRKQ